MDTAATEPTEPQVTSSWRSSIQPRTIPLLVLVTLQAMLNLSIATFLEVRGDEVAGMVVGTVFSQIVLIAVGCVLAPVHFGTRYIAGSAILALAALCMFRCAQRDGGGTRVGITMASAMFAQWLIYQLPLWYSRWKGWYLSLEDASAEHSLDEPKPNDLQFGISQLLVWTTIVAGFLGVMRVLLTMFGSELRSSGAVEIDMFVTFALGNSLLVLPLIYACFSKERMWFWLGISLVWAVVVSISEALFLFTLRGDRIDDFFVLLNVGQFVVVLATLMLGRLAGFRLNRRLDHVRGVS